MPESERQAPSGGSIDRVQLGNRIYFNPVYTEVARLIGYAGFPYRETDRKLAPLADRFGKEEIDAAFRELMTLVFNGKEKRSGPREDAEVRLKPEVRKLCWQLLGPPPEHKPVDMMRKILARVDSPKAETKPVREKKPRRKKSESAAPTSSVKATPIMQQYREAKKRHPNMLLIFRVGDFYELFADDAEKAAKILGLTLTTRDKIHTMAGFPHHALEGNLRKLLRDGQRVAICDQVDAFQNTTRREVTRVVMPAKTPDETADEIEEFPEQLAGQEEDSGIARDRQD